MSETGSAYSEPSPRRRRSKPSEASNGDARPAPPISSSMKMILDDVFAGSPKARADVEYCLASEGFTAPEMWLQLLGSEKEVRAGCGEPQAPRRLQLTRVLWTAACTDGAGHAARAAPPRQPVDGAAVHAAQGAGQAARGLREPAARPHVRPRRVCAARAQAAETSAPHIIAPCVLAHTPRRRPRAGDQATASGCSTTCSTPAWRRRSSAASPSETCPRSRAPTRGYLRTPALDL